MKKYHQQLLTTLVLSSILGMGLYAQPALAGSTEVVTRVTDKENDISGQTNISTNVYGGDLSLDADSIAALLDNTDVSVKNNKVIGENSAFTISRNKGIYGGYLKAEGTADGSPTVTFTVSGNSVSFSDSTFTGKNNLVAGGYGEISLGDAASVVLSPINVTDNAVNISFENEKLAEETTFNADLYGGYTDLGNANSNEVTITGVKAADGSNLLTLDADVFGGKSGGADSSRVFHGGSADDNTVNLKNVTLNGDVQGGYVKYGLAGISSASGNEVTIEASKVASDSTTSLYGGSLWIDSRNVTTAANADGTTTVSYTDKNSKNITYTLPAAANLGANKNVITLKDLEHTLTDADLYVYGGDAEYVKGTSSLLTANDNQVNISSTLNEAAGYRDVYGGYVDEGNADGNSVKITGKLLAMPDEDGNSFNTIVGSVIGGKTSNPIEFYGNAEHNNVTLENVQAGSVYGGNVYGLSGNGASSNTVTLIDSLVSKTYNVYATVADGAVYGGYLGLHLYHLDDEKPTIQADTAAKTATVDDSYITADAEKAGANSNIVNVSYSLDASTAYERVIGGYTEAGSANANQVTVSGKQLTQGTNLTIGAEPDADDRDAGYYPVPVIYIAAAGGIAACGTANENTLTLTNTSLQNDVYGGLVGSTQGGTFSFYGDYYMPNDLFTADATEANTNRVFLTDASSTGVIYGGYVVPDEGTAIAEAQANENTVQMVQTLDKETSYGDVLGGTALYGEANGNKVILQSTEKGSITATSVIGGGTGGTSADNNTVALTNSKASGSIIGGTTVLPAQKSIYDYDEDSEGYVHFHITKTYTSALSFTAAAEQSAQGNTVSLAKVNASGLVLGGMVMQGKIGRAHV